MLRAFCVGGGGSPLPARQRRAGKGPGWWAAKRKMLSVTFSEEMLACISTSFLSIAYLGAMKQGIKQTKALRNRALWLALALSGVLPMARAQAQRAPRPDTTTQALPALLGDTVRVRLELQPDSLVAVPVPSVDSVRLEWLRTPPTMRDLVCDRVGCFETEAPHQFNNSVMAYVTLFTARNRSYMQRVLERENFYFPMAGRNFMIALNVKL